MSERVVINDPNDPRRRGRLRFGLDGTGPPTLLDGAPSTAARFRASAGERVNVYDSGTIRVAGDDDEPFGSMGRESEELGCDPPSPSPTPSLATGLERLAAAIEGNTATLRELSRDIERLERRLRYAAG